MKYVAIKGMELPKSCAECGFVTDDMLGDATCVLLCDEWKDNENHRAENCPLVEIVTCKDCIYAETETLDGYCLCTRGDAKVVREHKYFCGYGERRE